MRKRAMNAVGHRHEESTSIYWWKVDYIFSYLDCNHQDRYLQFLETGAGYKIIVMQGEKKCLVKWFHVFHLFTYIFNKRNAANIP